ncbi:MAG TPA: M56 family metallopeptidase [Thermoanaerobaculia bacterium]|nr:M56 family metallopeptidase [Thermoanaerobaculia bacterium]
MTLPADLLDTGALAQLLLRGAVLLLAAAALRRLLRSSAERHRLGVTALALVLVLPLVTAALPPLPLPTLAALRAPEPSPAPAAPAGGSVRVPPSAALAIPEALRPARAAALPVGRALLLVWAGGTLLLLLGTARSLLALARLRRRATPLVARSWQAELARTCALLGVRRRVQLVTHPAVPTPMTWGALRPVVALPEDARDWSAPERHAVLLHELAHVRRLDAPWLTLARLARAVHWPDPLAWAALRRLVVEHELACDELVLAHGVRPSDYARQLLSLSRRSPSPRFSGAFAMARKTSLEVRLMSILDPRSHATSVPARSRRLPWALAALLLLAAGVAALGSRTAAAAMVKPPTLVAIQQERGSESLAEAAAAARELQAEMEVHQERMEAIARQMKGATAPIEELEVSLEPQRAELERLHAELERHQEPLRRLQEEMQERHGAQLAELQRRLEEVRASSRLEEIHREMEPMRRALEESMRAMEPVHLQMEQIHRQMEPVHRQMEEVHRRLEPFHHQMEQIHREMEPVRRRMEEVHRRLDHAVTRELRAVLAVQLGELGLDDAALDGLTERVRSVVNIRLDDDRLRLRASGSELRELLAAETGVAATHPAIAEAVEALLELDSRLE